MTASLLRLRPIVVRRLGSLIYGKKYLIELFSLHGCEYICNDKPSPISIDHIVKEHNAAEDEDEKEEIVNAFEKDLG